VTKTWRPVLALAGINTVNQVLWLTFAPIATGAATRLHVSSGTVGWLTELFPLVYLLIAIPIGMWLDRSLRAGLAGGAVLTMAGGLLRCWPHAGFGMLLAGQLLAAIAQPMLIGAITKIPERCLDEKSRTAGIALISASTFLGFLVALGTSTGLGATHLTALLQIHAGLAVLAGVAMLLALGRIPQVQEPPGPPVMSMLKRRHIRIISVLAFLGFGVFSALLTWTETLLQPYHVSSTAAGVVLIVMVSAGIVGSAVLPPLAHTAGKNFLLLRVIALVTPVLLGLLVIVPAFGTALVLLPALAVILLPALPVLLELSDQGQEGAAGVTASIVWWTGQGGAIVMSIVVGVLVNQPRVAFALLAACGLPLLYLVPRLQRAVEPETAVIHAEPVIVLDEVVVDVSDRSSQSRRPS
jgi:predicted MFS family arabinose efflux permease